MDDDDLMQRFSTPQPTQAVRMNMDMITESYQSLALQLNNALGGQSPKELARALDHLEDSFLHMVNGYGRN